MSVLVDTNVLLAATLPSSPVHDPASQLIERFLMEGSRGHLCPQIVREFFATATRPVAGLIGRPGFGFAPTEAISALTRFRASLPMLEEDQSVARELERLALAYDVKGKQIHDANLVAVARRHGVKQLATFNRRDFVRFSKEIEIVVPE